MIGLPAGIDVVIAAYAAGEAFGGLGKGGLVTIIVVSIIAIAAFKPDCRIESSMINRISRLCRLSLNG